MIKDFDIHFKTKYTINNKTKCWEWNKPNTRGYGEYYIGNYRFERAHRFSYKIYKGKIPKGLCVCHTCDNPKCVNPDHLWLGTVKENNQDCIKKERHKYKSHPGEENFRAKLTEKEVIDIREKSLTGYKPKRLSSLFNICEGQIRDIISYRAWKHI